MYAPLALWRVLTAPSHPLRKPRVDMSVRALQQAAPVKDVTVTRAVRDAPVVMLMEPPQRLRVGTRAISTKK